MPQGVLPSVWRELAALLVGYSVVASFLMVSGIWLVNKDRVLTYFEALEICFWLAPFLAAVLSITRVLPSLIAIRIIRTQFANDPVAGESGWRISGRLLGSEYLRLLKSKREEAKRAQL
jgi:hypothetical protein